MAETPAQPLSHRRPRSGGPRRLLLGSLLGFVLAGALAGTGLAWNSLPPGEPPAAAAPAPVAGTSRPPAPSRPPTTSGTPAKTAAPAPPPLPHLAKSASVAPRSPRKVTGELPFELPSTRELRRSTHLVFAHYFTPYPLSLDNKPADTDYYTRNYLTPEGENGKHAAYGGLLRDRPLPVAPHDGDWELANLQQEVRTAAAAGIDGFSVDILSLSGPHWDRVNLLLKAAGSADPGFRIMLMPDMTSLHTDPATLADALATLAGSPSAHHLVDGRLVVSPFKAEAQAPAWWSQVITQLYQRHGVRTAFVPLFLNFTAHAEQFAPISYGFSEWGSRSYTGQSGAADLALSRRLGRLWMQPVSVQDARPNQGIYDEAGNTATLRTTWGEAIEQGADWVQLTTWNDYSEGSQFAPSLHDGYAYLDISAYYLTRFKTGKWPAIVRDTVYLTSRIQPAAALPPPGAQSRLMRPRPGTAQPRDSVEVLTFLTAPATVHTAVGANRKAVNVPAGVVPTLLDLSTGLSSATVTRGGHQVAEVTSGYPVSNAVKIQDLQYHAVSSRRHA